MSRLSKTASAAVAALVVSGAAAAVSLIGPGSGGQADGAASGSGSGSRPAAASSTTTTPTTPTVPGATGDEASGLPGSAPVETPGGLAGRHTVLFLGDVPGLRPPGGSARSFACRAASVLGWGCVVGSRTARPAGPALRADVVVLVLSARDDGTSVTRALDGLPAPLREVRTVALAPMTVGTSKAAAARLAAVRRVAAPRGVDVVDPVAERWVTAQTRTLYLGAEGTQPTAAGVTYLGSRLAAALTATRA